MCSRELGLCEHCLITTMLTRMSINSCVLFWGGWRPYIRRGELLPRIVRHDPENFSHIAEYLDGCIWHIGRVATCAAWRDGVAAAILYARARSLKDFTPALRTIDADGPLLACKEKECKGGEATELSKERGCSEGVQQEGSYHSLPMVSTGELKIIKSMI